MEPKSNVLDLSKQGLKAAPSKLSSEIEIVELYENELAAIADIDFTNNEYGWNQVKELYLDHNFIESIPTVLCTGMISLTHLTLHNNKLGSLPANIGDLKNLRELRIDHNNIKELPDSICDLHQLQVLHIDGNDITSLPYNIGHLSRLLDLGIGSCKIDKLPPSFVNLNKLIIFWFEQRSFDNIPQEIINDSTHDTKQDIMEYLKLLYETCVPNFQSYFYFD